MTAARVFARSLATLSVIVASQQPAFALPTMIRLGYSECAACHISPQGGGPLNAYGRGIDRAQSLRGGEYVLPTDGLDGVLTFGGRTTQDFRTVIQEQASKIPGESAHQRLWTRVMYRNVTDIGQRFRISATITGETNSSPGPERSYDPPSLSSSVFVNTALLHYRAGRALEFAAGRDQLPSGVNLTDGGLWINSRNRHGYYDAPTQLKMLWSGSRGRLAPFVYRAGGSDDPGETETGAGTLAEFGLARQRMILGTSVLTGTARNGDRRTLGGYVRLGFGSWGILAEHDLTDRTRAASTPASFAQNASYGQVFWAAREWLVVSASGERLRVDRPFEEKRLAGKLELAARLDSRASVAVSTRLERDQITGRVSTSVTLQAAFKTVH